MNFPRVEGSPSHSGNSCGSDFENGYGYDDGGRMGGGGGSLCGDAEAVMDYVVPLSSVPPALRTNFYRDRRSLLE